MEENPQIKMCNLLESRDMGLMQHLAVVWKLDRAARDKMEDVFADAAILWGQRLHVLLGDEAAKKILEATFELSPPCVRPDNTGDSTIAGPQTPTA